MAHATFILYLTLAGLAVLVAVIVGAAAMVYRARRQCAKTALEEQDRLNTLFEAVPTGLVVFNERKAIVRLNSAAARMANADPATLINQRQGVAVQCVYRSQDERGCGFGAHCQLCPLRKVLDSVYSAGQIVRGSEVPMVVTREGGGQTVWLRVGAQPFQAEGRRHVVVSFDDITETKLNFERLEKMTAERDRLNVAKSQFLANTSHEIRTPLNGIIGITGLLLGTALTPEQREFVETIGVSGEVLLAVVNDILDFSKIEANKMVFEKESFVLQDCVDEAVRMAEPVARKKNLKVVCQFDEERERVWIGDVGRLRQVLVNLLGNAIKFTERGEIAVSVATQKCDGGQYRLNFSVRDSGVGIPPEQQGKLFQAFSQVDSTTARRFGGTGLGLAISKRLCELMGGEMSVESKGIPGLGSTFRFSIRVTEDFGTKLPAAKKSNEGSSEKRVLTDDDNAKSCFNAAQAPKELGRETEKHVSLKILLAEDNAVNQKVAVGILKKLGYSADVVTDGVAVVEAVKQTSYDLVLMDIQMPELDGLQATALIRKEVPAEKQPWIVAMTANVMKGDRERYLLGGMNDYIPKPIRPEFLSEVLSKVQPLVSRLAQAAPDATQKREGA